jgi:putative membrane protein
MKRTALCLAAATVLAAGCADRNDEVRPVVYQPATSTSTASARPALTEPQIIGMLETINQTEVQDAQLAQQRASSPQVREYATRLQTDHSMLTQHGSNLSSRLNLAPAPVFSQPDHRAALDSLKAKSGTDFDRAYIQHNITEHQRALRMLDDIARDARNPDVQTFVAQERPVVEMHLRTAQEIDRQLASVPPPTPPMSSTAPVVTLPQ